MNQSAILKACYQAIYGNLINLAEETKLFAMINGEDPGGAVEGLAEVCLGVCDISQLCLDKSGERVEVEEMIFEAPTQVGCIFSMTITAKTCPPLLEAAGELIQYFKDNNVILLGDFKWHGENEGKVFVEPVVRDLEPQKEPGLRQPPSITLKYRAEMGINSRKGTLFKRVEKRTIKGNIIDQ